MPNNEFERLIDFLTSPYEEDNWVRSGTKAELDYQLKVMCVLEEISTYSPDVVERVWEAIQELRG